MTKAVLQYWKQKGDSVISTKGRNLRLREMIPFVKLLRRGVHPFGKLRACSEPHRGSFVFFEFKEEECDGSIL
jgi:hypothetical protein